MDHGVTIPTTLQVHQIVHGYAQGHQQLAASLQLPFLRDTKTMLVLSDISGAGVRPSGDGYLTGYPLADSKLYVLARTWAALEMPRPGCVWTHSLLIDFADLATLSDPFSLLKLFKRPHMGTISEYNERLQHRQRSTFDGIQSDSVDFAQRALAGLYGRPRDRIVAAHPRTGDADHVVIAMWAQQWPRLRRAFRFCTLVGGDRSGDLGIFDLQLFPADERSGRTKFPDAVDISNVTTSHEEWVEDAVADLMAPDGTGLRSFMRQIGGDIDSGRDAFRPLCRLHVEFQRFVTVPDAIDQAIKVFNEDLGPLHAETARALVATEALKQPQLDDSALEFVFSNLELAEPAVLSEHGAKLGRQLWFRDPKRLSNMFHGNARERGIAELTLGALSRDELLTGAERMPELAGLVLTQRPELVEDARLWSLQSLPTDVAFALISKNKASTFSALNALLESGRDDLLPEAVRALGTSAMLRVLAHHWEALRKSRADMVARSLQATTREASAVAEFLVNTPAPLDMLGAIARTMAPDTIPNEHGTDPWLLALKRSVDGRAKSGHLFLYAFILTRALGWRSRNQAELAQLSFDPVYAALSKDRMPEDAWRLLETRLPWVVPWLSWDHCLRVRNAISDIFVERNLSAAKFAELAEDDSIFFELASAMARTYRGRRFLRDVRYELRQMGSQAVSRIRAVDDLIGSADHPDD